MVNMTSDARKINHICAESEQALLIDLLYASIVQWEYYSVDSRCMVIAALDNVAIAGGSLLKFLLNQTSFVEALVKVAGDAKYRQLPIYTFPVLMQFPTDILVDCDVLMQITHCLRSSDMCVACAACNLLLYITSGSIHIAKKIFDDGIFAIIFERFEELESNPKYEVDDHVRSQVIHYCSTAIAAIIKCTMHYKSRECEYIAKSVFLKYAMLSIENKEPDAHMTDVLFCLLHLLSRTAMSVDALSQMAGNTSIWPCINRALEQKTHPGVCHAAELIMQYHLKK